MDLNKAILYGQLVNAAYAVEPNDLTNRAGEIVSAGLGASKADFEIITTMYANDLATQKNPNRAQSQVCIGLILQAAGGDEAVIAFRGTEGIKEWVIDAAFGTVPCPFLAGAGQTEDGFTDMYQTVATATVANSPSLTKALNTLPWKRPIASLTVCGHSLGGALATLAALDIAANAPAPFKNPTVYTYASPRAGDEQFATTYNRLVPNTFRIANELDVVPKVPLTPPYEHVVGDFELKPFSWIPPKLLVEPELACLHILTSYLYLLSLLAGGQILELKQQCTPKAAFSTFLKDIELKWRNIESLKREFSGEPGRQQAHG